MVPYQSVNFKEILTLPTTFEIAGVLYERSPYFRIIDEMKAVSLLFRRRKKEGANILF